MTALSDAAPENSLNYLDQYSQRTLMRSSGNAAVWVGPPTEIKQVDDPCRVIEIVALTGQLYATDRKRPIATARATQKVSMPRGAVKNPRG